MYPSTSVDFGSARWPSLKIIYNEVLIPHDSAFVLRSHSLQKKLKPELNESPHERFSIEFRVQLSENERQRTRFSMRIFYPQRLYLPRIMLLTDETKTPQIYAYKCYALITDQFSFLFSDITQKNRFFLMNQRAGKDSSFVFDKSSFFLSLLRGAE